MKKTEGKKLKLTTLGFTLVELLAVILIIAVPQIMSVIESARKGSIESTAKLIAEGAEREYTNRKILGKDTNVLCSDVSSMNSNDYGTCSISFDNTGKATVTITGKGKFEGYTCKGNSTNMECFKGEIPAPTPTDAQYFTYSVVEAGDSESDRTADVTIKDKSKCENYLTSKFNISDDDEGKKIKETICMGDAYDESMSSLVSSGNIPSSDYETAGIEVNWIIINNVTIKDKDKCVAYLPTIGVPEENANTLCSDENELEGLVIEGIIPTISYETAGLEVTSRPFEADKISITGYNVEGGLDVVIPSEIDGKKVIEIGDNAFTSAGIISTTISNAKKGMPSYLYSDNKASIHKLEAATKGLGITSVIIPNTVTSIGYKAFEDNQLTEVTIPSSVTSIGGFAFSGNKLTKLTIPSNVTNIGYGAFSDNQLTSITFPTTPISVGCEAFNNNPITADGTYTYLDNVTVGGCK